MPGASASRRKVPSVPATTLVFFPPGSAATTVVSPLAAGAGSKVTVPRSFPGAPASLPCTTSSVKSRICTSSPARSVTSSTTTLWNPVRKAATLMVPSGRFVSSKEPSSAVKVVKGPCGT
ncbi:MAG: hypothetical protein QM704_21415 [Anaeromyxobacteraceae bacterium]